MNAHSTLSRTAYHETGHCLAALCFGIEIVHATLGERPHMQRARVSLDTTLEVRLTLCLAGPELEGLPCRAGADPRAVRHGHGHGRRCWRTRCSNAAC